MNTCFIILHYKVFEITRQCVDSILALNESESVQVVIVDNASPNDSGQKLQEYYADEQRIHVILLEKAAGFSHANNIGYQYCRENCDPQFVIIANNDIIFTQKEFITVMKKNYNLNPYAVGGPDVFDRASGFHINPFHYYIDTVAGVDKAIDSAKQQLQHLRYYWMRGKIQNSVISLKRGVKKMFGMRLQRLAYDVSAENEYLSGSCLIFTPMFLDTQKEPFYPETNFYFEESILFYQLKKENLKTYYDAEIRVLHIGAASTGASFKGQLERQRFHWKNGIESLEILKKLLEERE